MFARVVFILPTEEALLDGALVNFWAAGVLWHSRRHLSGRSRGRSRHLSCRRMFHNCTRAGILLLV
eukprot:12118712-Prorocentrum_lima.AAC.1